MNAIELFNEDGYATGVFICGECRKIPQDYYTDPQAPNAPRMLTNFRQAAEECCSPCICQTCKAEFEPRYQLRKSECDECESKRHDRARKQKIEKQLSEAEDVSETYDGPLYIEGCNCGDWHDGFFSGIDNVIDAFGDSGDFYDEETGDPLPFPEYAFACDEEKHELDIDVAIEHLSDNGCNGDFLDVPDYLSEAVKRFNEEYKDVLSVYHPDFKRKVRIPLEKVKRSAGITEAWGDED